VRSLPQGLASAKTLQSGVLRTPLCLATFVQLMEGQKAVRLQPFANDEADQLLSLHLKFFTGASERHLNVVVEGHQSLTFSVLMPFPSATTRDDALAYEPRLERARTPLVSPHAAIREIKAMGAAPDSMEAFLGEERAPIAWTLLGYFFFALLIFTACLLRTTTEKS
jgi:hypothetical protein